MYQWGDTVAVLLVLQLIITFTGSITAFVAASTRPRLRVIMLLYGFILAIAAGITTWISISDLPSLEFMMFSRLLNATLIFITILYWVFRSQTGPETRIEEATDGMREIVKELKQNGMDRES